MPLALIPIQDIKPGTESQWLEGKLLINLTQLQHNLQMPTKRKERELKKNKVALFTKEISDIK